MRVSIACSYQNKLGGKIIFYWKAKCLDNKFNERLKNCRMRYTNDKIDKGSKNEVLL